MLKPKISKDIIWITILCVAILLPYLNLIGLNKGMILGSSKGDIMDFFVSIRSLGFGFLSQGNLPLWNPYLFCGAPLLAESQLALFYPFNLIHLILSVPLAINLLIILHQLMAGIFMYVYLKWITKDNFASFIGASVFSLSSVIITRIFAGHLTVICAVTWIPLLFFLFDKATSGKGNIFHIFLVLVLCLQIFSGHTQFVFISLAGLFLYSASISINNYKKKRSLKELLYPFSCFFSSTILAVGLSAIQLLPLLELVNESMRLNNPIWSYNFSMPPENLFTILSPGFFGWAKNSFYWGKWFPWEVSLYVGILPLFFSFLAILKKDRFSRCFLYLFLLSLLLSLGAYLPLYKYIFKYMVGFNIFRASGRFLTLAVFSLSVLTALGCRELRVYSDTKYMEKRIVFIIAFGFILMLVLLSMWSILNFSPTIWEKIHTFIISYDKLSTQAGYNYGYLFYRFNPLFVKSIIIPDLNETIIFVSLSILLFIFYLKRLIKENLLKFLFASFIICDLLSFQSKYFLVSNIKDYYIDKESVKFLKRHLGQSRLLLWQTFNVNAAVLDRIPSIDGYAGVIPKRYNEFINLTQDFPLDSASVGCNIRKLSRLLELLNLKFILVKGKYRETDFLNLKKVFSNQDVAIYQTPYSLPKVFIVHKAEVIKDRDNIFKTLADESFNFRDTVILEEAVRLVTQDNSISIPEPEPIITTYSPNRVVIKTDTQQDAYLILCDSYNSGWKAYIDGKKTKVLKADYILRAVKLGSGKHTVEFIYFPLSLKIGIFVTLAFLALSIIILIIFIKKRKLKWNYL